jgi:hypothetical protein
MKRLIEAVALLFVVGCKPSVSDLAEDFCVLEYECYPEEYSSEAECVRDNDDVVKATGETCEDVAYDFMKCLADIGDCATLDAYWEESTGDYPCSVEEDALITHCDV